MNTSFLVKYGSGSAQGEIVQDYVSFGGYNVSNQAFAVVDSVSRDLLGGDIGGLMGARRSVSRSYGRLADDSVSQASAGSRSPRRA